MTIAEQITAFENTRAATSARMSVLMTEAAARAAHARRDRGDGVRGPGDEDDRRRHASRALARPREDERRGGRAGQAGDRDEGDHAVGDHGQAERAARDGVRPRGLREAGRATATCTRPPSTRSAGTTRRRKSRCICKAAIAPGTTTDATWAGPLVNANIAKDFIELLRPGDDPRQDSRPAERALQHESAEPDGRRHVRVGRRSQAEAGDEARVFVRDAAVVEGGRDHRADRGARAPVESERRRIWCAAT